MDSLMPELLLPQFDDDEECGDELIILLTDATPSEVETTPAQPTKPASATPKKKKKNADELYSAYRRRRDINNRSAQRSREKKRAVYHKIHNDSAESRQKVNEICDEIEKSLSKMKSLKKKTVFESAVSRLRLSVQNLPEETKPN
jgi:seryl-tRNA synthetase